MVSWELQKQHMVHPFQFLFTFGAAQVGMTQMKNYHRKLMPWWFNSPLTCLDYALQQNQGKCFFQHIK